MRIVLIFATAFVLLLTGCAKMMNENECLAADWRTVGFQDGSAGRAVAWLEKRGEACAEFGVAPDLDQYLMGRTQGLETFCQPRSGFNMGLRRTIYENVCPAELEGAFLNAYQDGLELRGRQNRVSELESAINASHSDMASLDDEIVATTLQLATNGLTEQERLALAVELAAMGEELGGIGATIPLLEAELTAAIVDLEQYRASIEGKYPGAI